MNAEPKRVELTEAEIDALVNVIGDVCSHAGPVVPSLPWGCPDCDETVRTYLAGTIERIVAARESAARREALLEAADWIDDAHPNVRGLLCAAMDIRGFAEVDVVDMADTIARVEALASGLQEQYEASDYSETASLGEIVKAIRAALAEPERDEEGGR